ncbi:hypothetical protein B2M27_24085 [Kluyvera intermedia]|uniref:AbrB/MazE/SpoVT family DNA-binding domain-containing protein n=1 Tax=Kluyvera intermedia TaxID=61648 RepID=A0ABX3U8R5_KLUIN|nr:hypothetical protein [Kluyvera intermedia]ORJ47834.1 hypothetical protein B2M27_24085 [Kluyvera intermedia]
MLKITMKPGDGLHVVLPDGSNGIIEARSRSELWLHLPKTIKLTRQPGAFLRENLIKRNQK